MRCSEQKWPLNGYNAFLRDFGDNCVTVKSKLNVLFRGRNSLRVPNIWSDMILRNVFHFCFLHSLYSTVTFFGWSSPNSLSWLLKRLAISILLCFHEYTLWTRPPKSLIMKFLGCLLKLWFLTELHFHPPYGSVEIVIRRILFLHIVLFILLKAFLENFV